MPDFQKSHTLSFGDSLFLYLERDDMPLNVASVTVFEGVIPLELCMRYVESKLALIPRFRQRVVAPPFNIGLPSWEYDPHFDLRNHIREVTLSRGTDSDLKAAAGKILSAKMDREKPLWDFTLVRGLKGDRTGMIIRLHHCLADGVSGVGFMNAIMETNPVPAPLPKEKPHVEVPPSVRVPSLLDSIIDSCTTAVERVLEVQSGLLSMAQQIVASRNESQAEAGSTAADVENAASPIEEISRMLPELTAPSERLPFNVVCHGPEAFNWAEIPVAQMKAVKEACGATLNDVVLALLAAAIRKYVMLHGVQVKGRRLRTVVPVNIRGNGDVSELGNRITFLPLDIPLDTGDPRTLIAAVHQAMGRLKSAHVAELVSLFGGMLGTIPIPLQAIIWPVASQLPLSVCNVICTNVPGPKVPLYMLGHKLLACYPHVPIGGEMGMNCAVLTYNGTAFFGFTGDVHAIPDLARMEKFLTESFAEFCKALGIRTPRQTRTTAKKRASKPKMATPAGEAPAEASQDAVNEEKKLHAGVGA